MTRRTALVLGATTILLTACGRKGDLKLPREQQAPPEPADQSEPAGAENE